MKSHSRTQLLKVLFVTGLFVFAFVSSVYAKPKDKDRWNKKYDTEVYLFGEKPIPFFIKKSKIQSNDEKMQQNRFLTEWLESIFISGISPKENIKAIIKND